MLYAGCHSQTVKQVRIALSEVRCGEDKWAVFLEFPSGILHTQITGKFGSHGSQENTAVFFIVFFIHPFLSFSTVSFSPLANATVLLSSIYGACFYFHCLPPLCCCLSVFFLHGCKPLAFDFADPAASALTISFPRDRKSLPVS